MRKLLIGAALIAAAILIFMLVLKSEHRQLSPALFTVFAILTTVFTGIFIYYLLKQMRK